MSAGKFASVVVLAVSLLSSRSTYAADAAAPTAAQTSRAQALLDSAESDGKYTFLVFYKADDAAAQTMLKTVKTELAKKQGAALLGTVSLANPAEQVVIKRFDVARAPMPLLLAVAPNGAVTGMFSKKIAANRVADCFVTPTMTHCMKALQQGKIVMVCVQTTSEATLPSGVVDLQNDPDFTDRVAALTLQADDEDEAPFLAQADLAPAKLKGTTTIVLAPPGVLVGTYASTTTSDEFAAALHEAGKCCNDQNCKHNHGAKAKGAAKAGAAKPSGARQAKQGASATRN